MQLRSGASFQRQKITILGSFTMAELAEFTLGPSSVCVSVRACRRRLVHSFECSSDLFFRGNYRHQLPLRPLFPVISFLVAEQRHNSKIRAPKRGTKGLPTASNLPLDHMIPQSTERSVTMDARMPSKNRSQTDSVSSTGGLVIGCAPGGHLSVPVANDLGSVSGLGGLSAFKAHTDSELNTSDGVANLLSEEANECTLARILELLGSTSALALSTSHAPSAPGEHPVGRVGSSGSSISASALPSNGLKPASNAPDGHALSVSQQQITPHLLLTTSAPGTQPTAPSTSSLTYKVALAFTVFYRLHNAQLAALKVQQANAYQDLREELNIMRRENLDLQNSISNLTVELGAIRRDAHTREELQNQKLSNAIARIEQLDATAEQSRQSLQHDLVNLHNEFRDGLYSLEYQLTTKTRDLSDNIATISNKVSIIEKPSEHGASGNANNSELSRIRHKVLHYLTDLCVSLFALLTMLLQVIIRCLNLGAAVTENR
ncbi:hypothetical protein FBUS_05835 [Fasciolopsis buskii]|uniref:Uncharacterized protein n=1 Tax=Fasciolopsis buskii TaxID=27845 RepID=A0A8E0S0W2_9TREM|nr:hypothetical protein FBUS_05835 [Fasciolopsis buski]